MNRKTKAAFVCIAICSMIVFGLLSGNTGSVLVFCMLPFTLVGDGLRALSLSGVVGNAIAIILYVAICLCPLLLLIRNHKDGENWLLLLSSATLFYVLYMMINPGLMPAAMNNDAGKMICSGLLYSIFISWGSLRFLRSAGREKANIYKMLYILLSCYIVLWVVAGFGVGLGNFKSAATQVQAGNTMPGLNLYPTYAALFLRFAVQALEYGLDAELMMLGIDLLKELEKGPYRESCCDLARKISKRCKIYLIVIVLTNLALNLGQVLFASNLHNVDMTVRIPILSMALLFATMALTQLLAQGKELKEENDLYI